MRDKIIKQVVEKFLERNDEPNLHKWLNNLQEELTDAIDYIQKIKMETSNALEEKLLNDFLADPMDIEVNDPITISHYPEPGPPDNFGWKTNTT